MALSLGIGGEDTVIGACSTIGNEQAHSAQTIATDATLRPKYLGYSQKIFSACSFNNADG
jgi:hypothetical protein